MMMENNLFIVGLGNPGNKYKNTRHNVGFIVLQYFIDKLVDEKVTIDQEKKFNSLVYSFKFGVKKVYCVFPLTFMNLSGQAVSSIVNYYKIVDNYNLVVVYDDMSLELGEFKLKFNGGDGGHNGVKSIIQYFGKDFARVKVGISRPSNKNYKDYVLSNFTDDELQKINNLLPILFKVLLNIVEEGFFLTMSKVRLFIHK
jgi:PTH1 family peptidyl-tRNA hydrolase